MKILEINNADAANQGMMKHQALMANSNLDGEVVGPVESALQVENAASNVLRGITDAQDGTAVRVMAEQGANVAWHMLGQGLF